MLKAFSNVLMISRSLCDDFRTLSTKLKISRKSAFFCAYADVSVARKFAQGIVTKQRPHQSRAIALRKVRKLFRSQTNSQILRNLDFSDQNLHFFDTPIDARFPMLWYYSKSLKGSTSHFRHDLVRAVNRQPGHRAGGM